MPAVTTELRHKGMEMNTLADIKKKKRRKCDPLFFFLLFVSLFALLM